MSYSIEIEEQIGPAAFQRVGAAAPPVRVREAIPAPQHVLLQERLLIETLRKENDRLKKESSRRHDGQANHKKTITDLELKITELQQEPIKAAKAAATKDAMLRQQELDIMKLEAEVDHLKSALSSALSRPVQVPVSVPSPSPVPTYDLNRDLLDKLNNENEDFRNQILVLKQQIIILESEREEIRERVQLYESGVDEWKQQVTEMLSSQEEESSLREEHLRSQLLALQNLSSSETTSLKTVIESEKTRISAMKEELNARRSLTRHSSSPDGKQQITRHVSPPPRSDPTQLVTLRDDLSKAVSRLKNEVEALSTKPYRVKNPIGLMKDALKK